MKTPSHQVPWMTLAWATVATVHVLCTLPRVDAHGFLTVPKVEFNAGTEDPTAYSATIDGATALPVPAGMHYDWGPSFGTEAFTAAFGNSSYTSLREFVMEHQILQPSQAISPDCGRTNERASAAQLLPEMVVWQHGDNEGFTPSHEGPCEIWCDDERVFAEKNCAKTYPHVPAVLPYERAKCIGKARLQMVWLALHEGTRWQVYMNCAPLSGATAVSTIPTMEASSPSPAMESTPTSTELTPTVPPTVPTMTTISQGLAAQVVRVTKRPSVSTQRPHSWPEYSPATYISTNTPGSIAVDASEPAWSATASPGGHITCGVICTDDHSQKTRTPSQLRGVTTRTLQSSPTTRRATEVGNGQEDREAVDEKGNSFAEKATGPIPAEVFEEARKDFEADEKKKEDRRHALKKEFGYA